jgi:hypothetical protein
MTVLIPLSSITEHREHQWTQRVSGQRSRREAGTDRGSIFAGTRNSFIELEIRNTNGVFRLVHRMVKENPPNNICSISKSTYETHKTVGSQCGAKGRVQLTGESQVTYAEVSEQGSQQNIGSETDRADKGPKKGGKEELFNLYY